MRLIDANKLIDYFYYGENDKPIIDGIADRKIIDIIKSQPTAFNVDKVVEELNEQWNDISCIDDDMYCIGVANGLAKAIDIVKRGGVE